MHIRYTFIGKKYGFGLKFLMFGVENGRFGILRFWKIYGKIRHFQGAHEDLT